MISSDDPLGVAISSWTLWALAVVSTIFRFVSRRLLTGPSFFRELHVDDYLMVLALASLTGVVVSTHEVMKSGSNLVAEGETADWPPDQIAEAAWGSKMLVALEEFMLCTLWLVKACLLLLYARMTSGLRESLAVKITGVYCAIGFIVAQVLYLGVWCQPVTDYWAVPIPADNEQCMSYHNHLITVTVFHVSSDLIMLCIPIPMIARTRLPLKRKLVLCGVFGLGVLVVLLAILNRYYNFTMPYDLVFLVWYNGEGATAIIIANIPFCWALLRRMFSLGAWKGTESASGAGSKRNRGMVPLNTHGLPPTIGGTASSVVGGRLSNKFGQGKRGHLHFDTALSMRSESGSMERITGKVSTDGSHDTSNDMELAERKGGILVVKGFTVSDSANDYGRDSEHGKRDS
ncbi:hypothetical protein B0H67DRAFT_613428 [Lasiosphaeris hirsuta]|uniref:Rhodopsin domain-containing protein n=1 Tax=Lasiosphaeris hirsuta TaxID=260670 RepID=A0AA39ZWG5_9PEZI|nr:hypothetical protein B0H67DRAFT_613428 [Lasiosphaeris hirsuta]